jgi:predicted CopG family antitoxin
MKSNKSKLRLISVTEANYCALKKKGFAGDSFNDVITEVLRRIEILEQTEGGRLDI